MNFVSPKVACISINLLSSLPLNTVMSGLVLQVITCICWMSYRNGYLVLAARWTLVIVARYLELLARYRNVASLSLLLVFLWKMFIWIVSSYSRWNYIRYSNKFHDLLSPFLDAIRMSLSTLFFLVILFQLDLFSGAWEKLTLKNGLFNLCKPCTRTT